MRLWLLSVVGAAGTCTEADGCAGCTTDGNGDSVTESDCEWKVFDDGHSECFRTDDSTHCQTGPPESAKSNFVDSFILKFQSDFDRLTFGWAILAVPMYYRRALMSVVGIFIVLNGVLVT